MAQEWEKAVLAVGRLSDREGIDYAFTYLVAAVVVPPEPMTV